MAEWGFARRQRARPGGRRGRPGDLRTCGLADLRTCGLADLRTCGLADLRTCGLADLRTCGLAQPRANSAQAFAEVLQTCAKPRQPRAGPSRQGRRLVQRRDSRAQAPPGRVADLCKDETAARSPPRQGHRLVQRRDSRAQALPGGSQTCAKPAGPGGSAGRVIDRKDVARTSDGWLPRHRLAPRISDSREEQPAAPDQFYRNAPRITSSGAATPNQRSNAAAPCPSSISVPSAARTPHSRACPTHGVTPPRR
jgi:hypothetical protein